MFQRQPTIANGWLLFLILKMFFPSVKWVTDEKNQNKKKKTIHKETIKVSTARGKKIEYYLKNSLKIFKYMWVKMYFLLRYLHW